MRSAAATVSFDDVGFPAKGGSRSNKSGKKSKGKRAGKKRKPSKLLRYCVYGLGGAIGFAILANALFLQKGRHPAPLLGPVAARHTAPPIRQAEQPQSPPPVAIPKPTGAEQAASSAPSAAPALREADAPPLPSTRTDADGQRPQATQTVAGSTRSTDAIARLIATGGIPAAADRAGKPAKRKIAAHGPAHAGDTGHKPPPTASRL